MPRILKRVAHHFNPVQRERGALLRKFATTIGLVYFGAMDQHKDDYDAIRGFTASLRHIDKHYAVGTYEGYDLRFVDRFDSYTGTQKKLRHHSITILEVELHRSDIPHIVFVPTGQNGGEYERLFTTQPHMQPINSLIANHSPEFHGRYQILARSTHTHAVESHFSSPLIVGIGVKFWPQGIELHNGKLYVYITSARLSKTLLESTLQSSLWLAKNLDANVEL